MFIPCLTINHPSFTDPIRLAYNTESVMRTAGEFKPYPFQINLPSQVEDEPPSMTLTVDNTDLEVNDAIRTITGQPTVTFDVVLASSPNTVEAGPFVMGLQNAQADAQTITGTLGYEIDLFSQLVPSNQYLPTSSPGLFL